MCQLVSEWTAAAEQLAEVEAHGAATPRMAAQLALVLHLAVQVSNACMCMGYARSPLPCCSQDLRSAAAEQLLPVLLAAVTELVPHCCGRATRLQSELISRCASAVCSVYLASGGRSGSSKQLHAWLCEAIAHPHPFVALIARTTW